MIHKESGSTLGSKCLHFDPIIFYYYVSFSIFKKALWGLLLSIIQLYVKFEQEKFGRKLMVSSSDLVAFMKCGVDTTNNAAERELRIIIHRKIRGQMINEKGMRMFGILMTNYLTWKRRGVSIKEMSLKCLRRT